MTFYDFLNIIFAPILKLPDALAIVLMALLISLIIIIITKFTTDQALMKKLKDEIKEYQNQAKQLKDNPTKAMEVQKKAMEVNMKYMTHSLRPTLITIIPIILIFGWMSATFAYQSIHANQEFDISAAFGQNSAKFSKINIPEGLEAISKKTAEIKVGEINGKKYDKTATWTLKGKEGRYTVEFEDSNTIATKEVLITQGKSYAKIENTKKPFLSLSGTSEPYIPENSNIILIGIDYKKNIVLPVGFRDWLGWLGTYIWSSIIFTMALRKILKVY